MGVRAGGLGMNKNNYKAQKDRIKINPEKAQGTIEYLVILAIVIVISLLVAGLATGFLGSGSSAVRVSQDVGSRIGSGGISILEGASDTNGDTILRLRNSTGEGFTITKISGLSGGTNVVDKQFNDVVVPGGGEVSFSLDNLTDACVCGANDTRKVCEFEVTLTSANGLVKKQHISKSVDCVTNTTPGGSVVQPFKAIWVQSSINSAGGATGDYGNKIFVDSNGNVYLAGSFTSPSIDFGNGVSLTSRSFYMDDFFVVKYNSSGVAQWAKNPAAGTGSGFEASYSMYVDSNGGVYVAGIFMLSNLGFGDGVTLTNRGNSDFFVVKYTSSGVAQWAKNPGQGTGTGTDFSGSVFVDSSYNVYLAGYFASPTVGFGNDINLTNRGSNDFFIVKYNSAGVAQWAKNPLSGTGANSDNGWSVFVDSSGNVYLAGDFNSSLSFGNDVNLTNRGNSDFFVVKYNSGGVAQWAKNPFSGTGMDLDTGRNIFVDLSGNVYVGGNFYLANISFGNDINLTNRGGQDFFVVKYNSSGVAEWAKNPASGSGADYDIASSVFVDSSGNLFVSGTFYSPTMNFGEGVSLTNRASSSADFFVVKYNSNGTALWAQGPVSGTGAGNDYANSVFVDSSGDVYFGGDYSSNTLGFSGGVVLTNPTPGIDSFYAVKAGYR